MIPRPPTHRSSLLLRARLAALLGLAALECVPATPPTNAGSATAEPAAAASASAPARPGAAGATPAAQAAPPGAAAAVGAPAAASQEPKFDFEAMLARERPPAPALQVVDPKGRWRTSIEARRAPLVVDRGDHVSIRTPLAGKDEVRCEVHESQLNPGVTIANLLGAAMGTVSLEGAVVYRVSAAGDSPIVFVRARYQTRDTPPLGGELKLAISPSADYSFVCLHDEPGFRETFAHLVEGLVRSFETIAPRRTAEYTAIWQLAVGEAKTGYSWERIYADPDGGMSSYSFDLIIAQLASGELRIRDDLAAEVHDRRGILGANYLSYLGTTKLHELQIERGESNRYAYRGVIQGKPAEGKLEPKAPLASRYELMLALQRVRPGKPLAFRQEEYNPRQDPRRVQSVEYTLDAAASALTRSAGGARDVLGVEHGMPGKAPIMLGPNTVAATLVARSSVLGSAPGVTVGVRPAADDSTPLPLAERRRGFDTRISAETDHTPAKTPPAGIFSKVTYAAPLGANVAYVTPPRKGAKRPAVIWLGGGLDWGIGEGAWAKAPRTSDRSARAFREAGLTLMLPALRGSNENPGKNECFFGEVDDVIAAAEYLAAREDVDPDRVYLAGHATGGTLALLAAASTDRFAAVFAFGPVGDARQYGTPSGGGCLPENASADEIALRAPLEFLGSIHTPTFVFEGGVGGNADIFEDLRESASSLTHFTVVPGVDSTSIVAPGTEAIARAIAADRVDDEHLTIEPGAARP